MSWLTQRPSIVNHEIEDDEEMDSNSENEDIDQYDKEQEQEEQEREHQEYESKLKTWESSSHKWDPVPLPLDMIQKEYEKIKCFLPMKVRAKKTSGMITGTWLDISKDLRTSKFSLVMPNGEEKIFVDSTKLLRQMMMLMTVEDQQKVVPPKKSGQFQDPRLRPWEMLEGEVHLQGWFVLKAILKSHFRVKKSAEKWLEDNNINKPKKKQINYNRSLILNGKMVQYKKPDGSLIFHDEKNKSIDEIVIVQESISKMVANGAPDEMDLRNMIAKKTEGMNWTQLSLGFFALEKISQEIQNQNNDLLFRTTTKSLISDHNYEQIDGPNQSFKALPGVSKKKNSKKNRIKLLKDHEEILKQNQEIIKSTITNNPSDIRKLKLLSSEKGK